MNYDTGWHQSTRSAAASDACVEVRLTNRAVSVRDSKNPGGGELSMTHTQWSAFLSGLRPHD